MNPYSSSTDAQQGLTAAFNPMGGAMTAAQQSAINNAASLVPTLSTSQSVPQASNVNIPPPSSTMDASTMANYTQGGKGINYPATPAVPDYSAKTMALTPTQIYQTQTPDVQNVEGERKSLLDQWRQFSQQLTGKAQAQQQAYATAGIPDLQKQLNTYNTQLQQLQNDALVARNGAEDRTAPMFAINGEQAQIERERYSKALAISSLASGVNNDITNAKSLADQAISAQFDPIQQQADYLSKMIDYNYQDLTSAQKKQADLQKAQLDDYSRQLDQQKSDRSTILAWANQAAKNFPNDPQAQLAVQKALDPNTTDLQSAFSMMGKYLSDPMATQKALLELQQMRSIIANNNANAAKTQRETQLLGMPTPKEQLEAGQAKATQQNDVANNLSLVNDILQKQPGLYNVFGFGSYSPYALMPGTAPQYLKNQVQQLKDSLSLENRQKLKGSGAISDFESRMLANASSALGGNISPEDAAKELKKIRGVFQTANGGSATVKLTDKSGKSQILTATRDGINQAITDGLTVEYQ